VSTLIKRAAPGFALATVTLGAVWMFDPALNAQPEPLASAGDASATGSASASDTGTSDTGTSDPGASDSGSSTAGQSTGSDCSTAQTATGDAAYTQWGPVQVEMAVTGDGTICSVEAIAYPDNDTHSARINSYAIPQLNSMAASKGVSFQAISGATYTSEAYRESMQSVLDRL
jgi:uncharacterized protein with FMN-binding domain